MKDPREGKNIGCGVSQAVSVCGVRSGTKSHFIISSLFMISLCKSPHQTSVFLPVKWECSPLLAALGRFRDQLYGMPSTVLGREDGKEPPM